MAKRCYSDQNCQVGGWAIKEGTENYKLVDNLLHYNMERILAM